MARPLCATTRPRDSSAATNNAMLRRIKRVYGPLYFLGNLGVFVHSVYEAAVAQSDPGFWGAALATLPGVFFFVRLTVLKHLARTSASLPSLLVGSFAGIALTLFLSEGTPLAWVYSIAVGLLGSQLYTWWYSVLGRPAQAGPNVGDQLPLFEFRDQHGELTTTSALDGEYVLLLFYRGSWCPLCTTQIQEIAADYQKLASRGVRTICLSPQPETETRALAERFAVPMTFGVDEDGRIAEKLGLWHTQGIPLGVHPSFGSDTVFPTVLLADGKGEIIFADLTDNYRVRPEPSTFLSIIDAHNSQGQADPNRQPKTT